MAPPLLARFALDAQESFLDAAEAVPPEFHERAPAGLNPGSWIVTHAAAPHQLWIGAYVGGFDRDPWFDAWQHDRTQWPSFAEGTDALRRVFEQATGILNALADADLRSPGKMLETSRFSGWTVGQLIARAIAHLYSHAADLGTLAALAGGDVGIPGFMPHTRMAP